jgi:hypothetical protein
VSKIGGGGLRDGWVKLLIEASASVGGSDWMIGWPISRDKADAR